MFEPNVSRATRHDGGPRLEEIDWKDVRDPGSYLHVSTGMLMRFFPEESGAESAQEGSDPATPMVKLSSDPQAPLATLRAIAVWYGYLVQF
jgi:hypothetical protein